MATAAVNVSAPVTQLPPPPSPKQETKIPQVSVPSSVSVPLVSGMTQADAVSAITSAGLQTGATTQVHNTVPFGTVINQSPTGGTSVPKGTSVSLQVSLGPEVAPPPPPPPGPKVDTAELRKLEDQLVGLSSLANARRSSLDDLQRRQNAQGLGLRSDILAAADRMTTNINRAEQAIQDQDTASTRRYMDQLRRDLETVERFLGLR
jgi:hypothetical protein